MGAIHGHGGVVKVGDNAVALVKAWTSEKSVENPEKTAMGDTDKSYLTGGPIGRAGTVTCLYDKSDANGQKAFVLDSQITLHLQLEGDASGDEDETGPAIIQKIGKSTDMGDAVEITFDWIGNGAWTEGALA